MRVLPETMLSYLARRIEVAEARRTQPIKLVGELDSLLGVRIRADLEVSVVRKLFAFL